MHSCHPAAAIRLQHKLYFCMHNVGVSLNINGHGQTVSIVIVLDSEMCALLFRKMGLNVNSEC